MLFVMTNIEIEKRIAILEAEVALLKSKVEKKDDKSELPWWEQRVGVFADDPIYDEAMRLGREYRESQRMVYDEDED
jgi:hypothetical protein